MYMYKYVVYGEPFGNIANMAAQIFCALVSSGYISMATLTCSSGNIEDKWKYSFSREVSQSVAFRFKDKLESCGEEESGTELVDMTTIFWVGVARECCKDWFAGGDEDHDVDDQEVEEGIP